MPETIKGFGTLTPLQKEFMEILASLPDKDQFYLAGGTALSEYYLGHRLSFDLDYFTGTENLILPLSYQIETACQKRGLSLKVVRRFGTFVELLVEKENESLKIDLALDSPYRFESPVLSNEGIYACSKMADTRWSRRRPKHSSLPSSSFFKDRLRR